MINEHILDFLVTRYKYKIYYFYSFEFGYFSLLLLKKNSNYYVIERRTLTFNKVSKPYLIKYLKEGKYDCNGYGLNNVLITAKQLGFWR